MDGETHRRRKEIEGEPAGAESLRRLPLEMWAAMAKGQIFCPSLIVLISQSSTRARAAEWPKSQASWEGEGGQIARPKSVLHALLCPKTLIINRAFSSSVRDFDPSPFFASTEKDQTISTPLRSPFIGGTLAAQTF